MSLWSKAKNAVYGFVTGAAKSLPMTILYAASACGISAALGTYVNPGMDFLHIIDKAGGINFAQIAFRTVGSAIIGATISGTIEGYSAATSSHENTLATNNTSLKKSQTAEKSPSSFIDMNHVSPSFTPQSTSAERIRT